ncbi:uncharacterized protein LOC129597004 [Paramacrobiotus metropolitanus]|uniref:uncharacterized protein LOC129597004 n=1 Tax=Paramacrobiotus metropolitanus TaxID=2943436 RepID=UPI002445887D|nr:uncharacterized protein LOC129597004 [Paramacrobiotus metropolitanus]
MRFTAATAVIGSAVVLLITTISAQNLTTSGGSPADDRANHPVLQMIIDAVNYGCTDEYFRGCRCNEQQGPCGLCDPTCNNRSPKCPVNCKPGCMCKPGYIRTATNGCQPVQTCPQPQPPPPAPAVVAPRPPVAPPAAPVVNRPPPGCG